MFEDVIAVTPIVSDLLFDSVLHSGHIRHTEKRSISNHINYIVSD